MIIGVVGMYASGKDTVGEYLQKQGFAHFSLSDEIREEMELRGLKISRDTLIPFANDLRSAFGPAILANRVRAKLHAHNVQKGVITSIRNPSEVAALQDHDRFVLIEVRSNIHTRLQRMKERKREEDPMTLPELQKREKMESSSDPAKQQLHTVIKMAKIVIKNDGGLEELYRKIDGLVTDLEKKWHSRPSWDEYFMSVTRSVAGRATCNRGRSGCVIVKDKRILATGYVGAPAGLDHCDEVGHLWKEVFDKEGGKKTHCIRTTHAEQNAFAQAARFGVSLQGATVYCKMEPCLDCTKILINVGIKRVVCEKRYHAAHHSREFLKGAGVKLKVLNDELETYSRM